MTKTKQDDPEQSKRFIEAAQAQQEQTGFDEKDLAKTIARLAPRVDSKAKPNG